MNKYKYKLDYTHMQDMTMASCMFQQVDLWRITPEPDWCIKYKKKCDYKCKRWIHEE